MKVSNSLIQRGEKNLDSLNKKSDLPNSPQTGEIRCHCLATYLEARETGTIADLPTRLSDNNSDNSPKSEIIIYI